MKKFIFLLTVLLSIGLSSCLKENYDVPATGGKDPDMVATVTLDTVKSHYTGTPRLITEDWVIQVLVVADDKSGNFYNTIVVEDSTAGIALKLDRSGLYTEYPVGRRLFVKLKGLWIGDYNGLVQIGGYLDEAGDVADLPSTQFDQYIFKGVWGLPVIPHAVTINQLNDNYQNRLIELTGVEFQTIDAGRNYADGYNKISVNRTVKNCSGGNMIVRTSGYASFANTPTPTGKGNLVAIYSVFGNDGQLLIRDLNDVKMDSTRCGGGGTGGGNGIMGVRNLWGGSDVTIPSGKTVKGIVISDHTSGSTDPKNMVIQDSTGGIVIRFNANHSFAIGQEVSVDLSGLNLTSYNGLIEVEFVPNSNATVTGTGTITPRVATCDEIQNNTEAWESTLVTINNTNISGSGTTYSGTKTITDVTGTLTLYTRSQSSFATTNLPSGTVAITGVLGDFNGAQLSIRTLADVQ